MSATRDVSITDDQLRELEEFEKIIDGLDEFAKELEQEKEERNKELEKQEQQEKFKLFSPQPKSEAAGAPPKLTPSGKG